MGTTYYDVGFSLVKHLSLLFLSNDKLELVDSIYPSCAPTLYMGLIPTCRLFYSYQTNWSPLPKRHRQLPVSDNAFCGS